MIARVSLAVEQHIQVLHQAVRGGSVRVIDLALWDPIGKVRRFTPGVRAVVV